MILLKKVNTLTNVHRLQVLQMSFSPLDDGGWHDRTRDCVEQEFEQF